MRAIILSVSLLMFMWLSSAVAQEMSENKEVKDVPAKVKSEFTKLYPDVKDVKWYKEEGKYEGRFTTAGNMMAVHINSMGQLVAKETFIQFSALPKQTQDYLNKNHPGAKFDEISEITKTKNNEKYFEVDTKGKVLMFDMNGKYLKEKNEKMMEKKTEKKSEKSK